MCSRHVAVLCKEAALHLFVCVRVEHLGTYACVLGGLSTFIWILCLFTGLEVLTQTRPENSLDCLLILLCLGR